MPMLERLKASATETLCTTVSLFIFSVQWESSNEKTIEEISYQGSTRVCQKACWKTPWSTGRKLFGLMRLKWSFLALRLDAMFGGAPNTSYCLVLHHLHLHYPASSFFKCGSTSFVHRELYKVFLLKSACFKSSCSIQFQTTCGFKLWAGHYLAFLIGFTTAFTLSLITMYHWNLNSLSFPLMYNMFTNILWVLE